MRRVLLVCGLVLLFGLPASAQDLPKWDVFGGYSFVHFSIPQLGRSNITSNMQGASFSGAYYLFNWLGIVGDVGFNKFSTLHQGPQHVGVSGSLVSYLFGPRIRLSGNDRYTPFVQVLFGGAHNGDITTSNITVCDPGTCTLFRAANAFAMTFGGGADIKISRHFSARGQGELLFTKFKDHVHDRQYNARISVGIVFH